MCPSTQKYQLELVRRWTLEPRNAAHGRLDDWR
jgi:hypothetical protein